MTVRERDGAWWLFMDYKGRRKARRVGAGKPGTSEKYEMILRKHWLPALGRLPVTTVSRDHIKTVLGEKLSAEFKPKTVRGHLAVLQACFSETNLGIIRSSS